MALLVSHPAIWNDLCVDLILGTGKTMLVKAVANSTKAAFIRVVGSEFVQKYLGEVRPISLRCPLNRC